MKQVEYLLRGKMYSTCGWTRRQTQGERESLSHTLMAVWIAVIGCFFWVSFGQSFCFAWFTVHIWYISGSSHVVGGSSHTSLPHSHLDRASLDIIPPLTSKEPFSAGVVREVSLTLRMRNIWSFISYLGKAQLCPSSCFYGVSAVWSFCSEGRNCSACSPSISCLKRT